MSTAPAAHLSQLAKAQAHKEACLVAAFGPEGHIGLFCLHFFELCQQLQHLLWKAVSLQQQHMKRQLFIQPGAQTSLQHQALIAAEMPNQSLHLSHTQAVSSTGTPAAIGSPFSAL